MMNPLKKETKISKEQRWLGIVAFLVCLALLGWAVLTAFNFSSLRSVSSSPMIQTKKTEKKEEMAQAKLYFSPSSGHYQEGEKLKVKVMVEAKKNKLTGAELYLFYDPQKLKFISLEPGSFFGFFRKPNILLKKIEEEKGKISFALGSFSPRTGQGELAKIAFEVKKVNLPQPTTLSFGPETKLAEINQTQSVLKTAIPANFILEPNK